MKTTKLAAIGDIHGNYTALAACLHYAADAGVTDLLFLGDYITDCPYPHRVITLLKEAQSCFGTAFIRGNREDYMCDLQKDKAIPDDYGSRMGNIYTTYRALQPQDISWFASMPTDTVVSFENLPPLTVCHGMPGDNRTVVRPGTPAMKEALSRTNTPYLLCAHAHLPFVYHDEKTGITVANGGSCGHPCRDLGTDAQMTILTPKNGSWHIDLVRVPYDVDRAVTDFAHTDFLRNANVWARAVRKTLQTGRNMTHEARMTVERLRTERGLPDKLSPEEEEPLWEEAADLLGIE